MLCTPQKLSWNPQALFWSHRLCLGAHTRAAECHNPCSQAYKRCSGTCKRCPGAHRRWSVTHGHCLEPTGFALDATRTLLGQSPHIVDVDLLLQCSGSKSFSEKIANLHELEYEQRELDSKPSRKFRIESFSARI